MITISLDIENRYELYEMVATHVSHVTLPDPPSLHATELREWADEHVFPLTGTDHEDGDSWYDVVVTGCSDPALIGKTFEFGY